jgi:hypothetical protein
MNLTAAGLVAMAFSFVLLISAAVWYVAPWMRRQPLALDLYVPVLGVTAALVVWRLLERRQTE